jgi:hypothetical protein
VTKFEKTPDAVFYWAIAPLAAFFSFFASALLPNVAALHPTGLAERLGASLPESLSCLVKICANWTYTLFFVLGELWGSVAISLLFWWVGRPPSSVCMAGEGAQVAWRVGKGCLAGDAAAGRSPLADCARRRVRRGAC